MRRFNPSHMLIISFLTAILIGTGLLMLPAATNGPERISVVDSLFTVTSATCVTGLTVKDTGTYFSGFGKWVILAMIQMGGLGIMTFSTLFAAILGRRAGLYESEVVRSMLDTRTPFSIRKLIAAIFGITFVIEACGAGLLFLRWWPGPGGDVWLTAKAAIFHSVSAFCNAGFSLFRDNLMAYEADPAVNMIMMALIFLGGIGFVVLIDVLGFIFRKKSERKLCLQSKVALSVSAALILFGAVFLLLLEKDNVMHGMNFAQRMWGAFFHSVAARTAGFNTLPIGDMRVPSLLLLSFLMFVGASPGSTGGGIKTCTFMVLVFAVTNMMKSRKRVMFFNRSVPKRVVKESIVIFSMAVLLVCIMTFLVTCFSRSGTGKEDSLVKYIFEVVSAFGTVGLSTGITEQLNTGSKLCIIVTMFLGRIGTVALALNMAFRTGKDSYLFPEEDMMVG